jgi:polysaccharide biosynthesis/export protein
MVQFNKQRVGRRLGISLAVFLLLLFYMPGGNAQSQPQSRTTTRTSTAVSAAVPAATSAAQPASTTATPATATPTATTTTTVPTAPSAKEKESLLIGPGDLVHVSIFEEPEMEQKVRVNDAGEITLTLIGKVKIAGMTPPEAASLIRDKYQAGSFLNSPQVSVAVEEYATETVSLLGQFQKPGPVILTTPRSLLDVISLGGGLTDIADRNIVIQRKSGEKMKAFVPNKPEAALEQSSVMIYPGDTVIVPKAGIVYVLGDVARPGGYVMNNDSQLTVLQALAMAAGTNKTAKENKARLVRKENDKLTEQRLELTAMQKGKIPDMPLQADDIIWVPFSWAKGFAQGASGIAASTSSAAIYMAR